MNVNYRYIQFIKQFMCSFTNFLVKKLVTIIVSEDVKKTVNSHEFELFFIFFPHFSLSGLHKPSMKLVCRFFHNFWCKKINKNKCILGS